MKNLIAKPVLIAAILISYVGVFAQQNEQQKTEISIEIDPATFAFNGYSAHLRIQLKNCDHLLFGAGIYAMDIPNAIVDFNSKNKDKGWDVRINQGYGLFAEHHFTEVNKKWFAGCQLAIQEYKIENENITGSEKFANSLLMAYGGYTWQPFDFALYIKPWAGIGYTSKVVGTNTPGNLEYDIAPITMFATLHLGYTF